MNWSYSQGKLFQKCPRQWYIKAFVASAKAKDPLRREAFLRSKLDSIWSWRGKIVDTALSVRLIPLLREKRIPRAQEIHDYARYLFDTQLTYAREHGIREENLVLSKVGTAFAAFKDIEDGSSLLQDDLNTARADIHSSINHLMENELLLASLFDAQQLIAQRTLRFSLPGIDGLEIKVSATPDVIVFRRHRSPLIIDWKVKHFSHNDAHEQLNIYGLALGVAKRHVDFPSLSNPFAEVKTSAEPTELLEYQLLDNTVRNYLLSSSEHDSVEDAIQISAFRMNKMISTSLVPADYRELPVAQNSEACQACNFSKICWESAHETN